MAGIMSRNTILLRVLSPWWNSHHFVGIGLGLVAVAARLLFLADSAGDPSFLDPLVDSRTYHDLAVGLARDGILTERFLWQAVFYPFFLSGVYSLFGVSVLAAVLVQVLLGGCTCYLTYLLGVRIFGRNVAVLAGLITALYGPLVFFDVSLLATGWGAFWMVGLAYLLVRIDRDSKPGSYLAVGLAGALAILTRPTFLPLMVFVVVWMLLKLRQDRRPWSVAMGKVGIVTAGLAMVLGPVAVILEKETGHTGILPPSGGINLYVGNNGDFERTINIRPGGPWDTMLSEPARNGYGSGPWNGQPYFMEKVITFAKENPGRQLTLLGEKTLQLVSSREMPRNQDVYLHRQWSGVLSAMVFKIGPWGFPWGLLFPLALVGLISSFRKIPAPVLIMLMVFGASLVLVFISARYRAPLVPLLAVLAAQGMVSVWWVIRNGNWPAVARLGIILLAGLLLTLPGPFAQEKVDLEPELYFGVGYNFYQRENWPEAIFHLQQSVNLDGAVAEPRNFLGISLARMGRFEEAHAQFDTALTLKPDYGEARRNRERSRRMMADD